jgi:hypothetical protein
MTDTPRVILFRLPESGFDLLADAANSRMPAHGIDSTTDLDDVAAGGSTFVTVCAPVIQSGKFLVAETHSDVM